MHSSDCQLTFTFFVVGVWLFCTTTTKTQNQLGLFLAGSRFFLNLPAIMVGSIYMANERKKHDTEIVLKEEKNVL